MPSCARVKRVLALRKQYGAIQSMDFFVICERCGVRPDKLHWHWHEFKKAPLEWVLGNRDNELGEEVTKLAECLAVMDE